MIFVLNELMESDMTYRRLQGRDLIKVCMAWKVSWRRKCLSWNLKLSRVWQVKNGRAKNISKLQSMTRIWSQLQASDITECKCAWDRHSKYIYLWKKHNVGYHCLRFLEGSTCLAYIPASSSQESECLTASLGYSFYQAKIWTVVQES